MATITIEPDEFILVNYGIDEIRTIAQNVATGIGFPADHPIAIDIEESTPLMRVELASLTPLRIAVEGGAFEDLKRPRQLSADRTAAALACVLFQAHDQLFGGFADAPATGRTLEQQIAWDVYASGRTDLLLGIPIVKQPRLYAFRNRHGFSDVSDAAFDRLWNATSLTWADLCAVCDETNAAKAG